LAGGQPAGYGLDGSTTRRFQVNPQVLASASHAAPKDWSAKKSPNISLKFRSTPDFVENLSHFRAIFFFCCRLRERGREMATSVHATRGSTMGKRQQQQQQQQQQPAASSSRCLIIIIGSNDDRHNHHPAASSSTLST
jgi:hypothetical protein